MKTAISFPILRLLETPGIGPAKVTAILDFARKENVNVTTLLENPKEIKGILSEKQIEEFSGNIDRTSSIYEKLEKKGVNLITKTEANYPEKLKTFLGKKAPPLLTLLGNATLLEKVSVGFCGSRKASEKGLITATDCADQLARQDINIISGYAAGVDMAAHRAALECGGTTVLVLCEGILNFNIKKDFKDIWDWERIAVVSEFLPGIPWTVRNAMQRNKTICALSRAMILIESGTKGGSIEAGRASLEMGVPLFAPVYEGMPDSAIGNQELLKKGARPLLKNRSTHRANMKDVFSFVLNSDILKPDIPALYPKVDNTPSQLVLFERNRNGYSKK